MLENETTKSNGLINEFQFKNHTEKPSLQLSGFDDIANNLSSNYDDSKYVVYVFEIL
jgi:hypothetical protein